MHIAKLHVLYDGEAIARRVAELAAEINACYAGQPLVVVCVLKGAFMFFGDLVRLLHGHPELDFVRLSSYGEGACRSDAIVLSKNVELSLAGKHVLLVEDIVDTGHSMHVLMEALNGRQVRSLRLAALVDKCERREVPVRVDFAGFVVPEGFIVGYGMDYNEQCRELPGLYVAEMTDD